MKNPLTVVILFSAVLFAFSYLVNERYPAEPHAINILQDETLPHYTGDTFRHLDPIARIFAGEKGAVFIDTEWARAQVMIFRPVYPFLASLGYRLTGDMSFSFAAVNFAFFVTLALASFWLARKFGLSDGYSLLLSLFVLSNPVVLVYSTLFMPDVPLLAMGTLALVLFWRIFRGKNEPVHAFLLASAVVTLMLFTKLHYLIYIAAPVVLYLGTRNSRAAAFSILVPLAAGLLWVFVINDFWAGLPALTNQYAYITENMGCPSCDLGILPRMVALLSVAYSTILFVPFGLKNEKDRQRLIVLSAIILLTLLVASSGYIGVLKRYYLPLLFPLSFYGVAGLRHLLKGLGGRREARAVAAIAAVQVAVSVVLVLSKYHGFTGTPY